MVLFDWGDSVDVFYWLFFYFGVRDIVNFSFYCVVIFCKLIIFVYVRMVVVVVVVFWSEVECN